MRWKSRITFCGHGEPTLNPQLLDIIKMFRYELPFNHMSLMTNGYGFKHGIFDVREFVDILDKEDFNELIFDVYSDNGDWTVIEELDDKYPIGILGEFKNKMLQEKFNILLYPLSIDKQTLRRMQNHCGAAAPLDYKKENTTCTKVFRELFIRWDGNVALCCDDFRGQYFICNALSDDLTLKQVWNHERFQAARIRLFNKDRHFHPCYGCNCPPNKAGFIPDITGGKDKRFMPKEISEEVIKITEQAYLKNGLTTIVKRKWEKE